MSDAKSKTDTLKRMLIALATLSTFSVVAAMAQVPSTLEEAKDLSSRSGHPILLEFYHDD
jgi:hypothetical protein